MNKNSRRKDFTNKTQMNVLKLSEKSILKRLLALMFLKAKKL
jgi:hypothetical protein